MAGIFASEGSLYGEESFGNQVFYQQEYSREFQPYSQYVGGHFQLFQGKNCNQQLNGSSQKNVHIRSGDISVSGESQSNSPETIEDYQCFPDEILELADITENTCQANMRNITDTNIFEKNTITIQNNEDCISGTAPGTWMKSHKDCDNDTAHAQIPIEPMKRVRRLRANDRERRRMRSLNRALESLKKCIPVPKGKRRVTKLEILRIACNYIRSLSDTLNGDNTSVGGGLRKRSRADAVVNGFSIAQRLEILSSSTPRI